LLGSPYRSSRSRHWSRARIRQARAALQPSGNDLTYRFPLIVESVARLRPRSCIIDGEAVVCDGNGMVSFDHIRYRRHDASAFLYAFDLIELNGDDLRRDPLKARKASLANIMARAGHGIWFNDHIEEDGETVFRHACKMGPSKASCRSGRTLPNEAADHPIGLK
jgi:ATP dependent DNA ligase domain